MSVTEERLVTIAAAEVTDEYTVDLHTPESVKHHTDLTPAQARSLAAELVREADRADRALAADLVVRRERMVQAPFDIDLPEVG